MPRLWGRKLPRKFFFAVGLYSIGYTITDLTWAAVMQNQRERMKFQERYGEGSWAVISGATNPTGQEYARQL